MALFDAEKIVTNLIRSLGVEPKDFIAFITMARDEFTAIRADRLAFRPASTKAYQDVVARLDQIDAKINLLLMRRDSDETRQRHSSVMNGNDDERDEHHSG